MNTRTTSTQSTELNQEFIRDADSSREASLKYAHFILNASFLCPDNYKRGKPQATVDRKAIRAALDETRPAAGSS
jgi:hypothetical protein